MRIEQILCEQIIYNFNNNKKNYTQPKFKTTRIFRLRKKIFMKHVNMAYTIIRYIHILHINLIQRKEKNHLPCCGTRTIVGNN